MFAPSYRAVLLVSLDEQCGAVRCGAVRCGSLLGAMLISAVRCRACALSLLLLIWFSCCFCGCRYGTTDKYMVLLYVWRIVLDMRVRLLPPSLPSSFPPSTMDLRLLGWRQWKRPPEGKAETWPEVLHTFTSERHYRVVFWYIWYTSKYRIYFCQ